MPVPAGEISQISLAVRSVLLTSESDPNVIYVGGGEKTLAATFRMAMASGNPLMAVLPGNMWGWDSTRHIPRIRHPSQAPISSCRGVAIIGFDEQR